MSKTPARRKRTGRAKPKARKRATAEAAPRMFSIKALHTEMDRTLERLLQQPKTSKRDELEDLINKLRTDSVCPQLMSFDIGA